MRMLAIWVAGLAALVPVASHAEEAGFFECYISGHPPPEPDPIIRIDVHIDAAKGVFDVAHHSQRGSTYIRDEQYQKTIPFRTEHGDDIWEGFLKRDRDLVMRGSFSWNDARNSFQYQEELSNRSTGAKETVTWSLCEPSPAVGNTETLKENDTGNTTTSALEMCAAAISDPLTPMIIDSLIAGGKHIAPNWTNSFKNEIVSEYGSFVNVRDDATVEKVDERTGKIGCAVTYQADLQGLAQKVLQEGANARAQTLIREIAQEGKSISRRLKYTVARTSGGSLIVWFGLRL
jgi:hypothetical protein